VAARARKMAEVKHNFIGSSLVDLILIIKYSQRQFEIINLICMHSVKIKNVGKKKLHGCPISFMYKIRTEVRQFKQYSSLSKLLLE
jgi:hypothetical protein